MYAYSSVKKEIWSKNENMNKTEIKKLFKAILYAISAKFSMLIVSLYIEVFTIWENQFPIIIIITINTIEHCFQDEYILIVTNAKSCLDSFSNIDI